MFSLDIYQIPSEKNNLVNFLNLENKAYNYNDLAPFCKLEVAIERAANFPIKIRLGEVQYVERMEGKY